MTKDQTNQAIESEFLPTIESAFGNRLESVILYGSYLKESFLPGVSDVNILIILSEIDPRELRNFGRSAQRAIRRHNITPLILSHDEFVTSADVFPMEHLDIVDTHRVLFGPDVTEALVIGDHHLRHELEHQLRGNLLSLRQLAVAAGKQSAVRNRELKSDLEQWFGSLGAILRGVLRLYGVATIPASSEELVEKVNEQVGLNPGPILRLIECRNGDCGDTVSLLDDLIDRLGALVKIIDAKSDHPASPKRGSE